MNDPASLDPDYLDSAKLLFNIYDLARCLALRMFRMPVRPERMLAALIVGELVLNLGWP